MLRWTTCGLLSVIVEHREHVEETCGVDKHMSGTEADLLRDVLMWGSIDLMQGGGFEMISDVGGMMSPSFYLELGSSSGHPRMPNTLEREK